MTSKVEGIHSAEFLLDGDEEISRDKVTLILGQNLASGTVLGKITASSKYTLHDAAAVDGSQVATAILYDSVDATLVDTAVVIISRLAEVIDAKLIFKSGISAPNRTAAIVALATQNIISRA